jgi:hypothetical protein
MQAVFVIKPGRGQLGMMNAAPANERELNGLELVHYSPFHFFQASDRSHANFCCAL